MKIRLMVDIETLSTRDNAACIAIGAVCLQKSKRFVSYMDIGLVPGHRDSNTLGFWNQQEVELKKKVFGGKDLPEDACRSFNFFYHSVQPEEIWANPPQFDLVIIRNLYLSLGLTVPWHYTEERDFRTLKGIAKERKIDYQSAYIGAIKHDPLSDAECQARAVEIILGKI